MNSPSSWYAVSSRGQSALMTRVGGRSYPAKVVLQCKTCTSPYRTQIENALLKSYGYAAIVKSLPEDANLNERNIMEHFQRGHLPLDESVRRVVIEEDARERAWTSRASRAPWPTTSPSPSWACRR